MAGNLSLLVPVPWQPGTGPMTPVSFALMTADAEPGPDDWQEAAWEDEMVRVSCRRPTPGRYAIWVDFADQPRRAAWLDVTD